MIKKESEKRNYKWYAGDWNKCSVSCGGGQRNRRTYCADENNTKVDEFLCTGIVEFENVCGYLHNIYS